uniref:C2H2-type domain-containing protein n=1 Tax=Amphiprion ocellaris TaxID=80972 RepID=A0AAQ5YA78_AMPOC
MARDRKCILCETVYISKQEMDEHMRSMLHHRELEKLKGRDCGHECRVCKVKVVSLTEYAGHISSPTHKQNVEAAERKPARNDHDEEYFDQALVELIEKRKEQIRKEKEATAAKQAKEEEDRRRKEEFQQRLKEAKDNYRFGLAWQQQPSQGFGDSGHNTSWVGSNRYNPRAGQARPWHHNNQGKSATWHAQEPPNLQKWASAEFGGRNFNAQEGRSNRTWGQGRFPGNPQNRLPWLSNGGSSNGLYGQNNISQYAQRGRPISLLGPPPSFFAHAFNQFQNMGSDQRAQQGPGLQNREGQSAEPERNSSKSSKAFGSNPKLDKACRWSPYPVAKGSEPHNDTNPNSSEKFPKGPKPQNKTPETSGFNRQSRPEQKAGQLTTSRQSVEDKGKLKTNPATKPRDGSSSSRSRSSQREGQQNPASGSANPKLNIDRKMSGLSSGAQLSKASSQVQSKPTAKQSGLKAPPVGPLPSRQEQQLPEAVKKARQIVLEKRGSLDSSNNSRMEVTRHIVEDQAVGVNKENSCRQNASKPEAVRPEKPSLTSSDSSQFLQSLQVSTSTMESPEAAASSHDDEESRRKSEKQTSSVALDDAMQVAEAGQSSESDTSRSGEAQTGSNSLSKLDLPPVLKRDLSKHISCKNKTGAHEPNLNIARRVRNLSESRRSDTEKDSGLKPTVRQLISSSGSRRNVNWEQVYQEVRKKQDMGKGMPRFGIEMVPSEQGYQSQEEDDIPLLEGFQWESLMDVSSQGGASRKRSLSESSIAPASTHSLFTTLTSKDTAQREDFRLEHQGSAVSPNRTSTQGSRDNQPEVGQMLDQFDAKGKKHPDKIKTEKAGLQRSDSVLGDSSSGTEQYDGQGTGKRRRAAGDVPNTESSCLEHNSKRRKVKPKKERLPIDQLLAVSLREDELSRSLQTVDTSLIQARAALEAAYMEVQRLMVVKQQMNEEMSSLRNKRIELLKGMQGTAEEAPQVILKEEKMDPVEAEPHIPSSALLPPVMDSAASSPGRAAECASPPSSSLPFMTVVVKQEPQSPVHVSQELDAADGLTHCAHSTTPELPVAAATTSQSDPPLNFPPSPERKPEPYQTNYVEPADYKEKLQGLVEMTEKGVQAARSCLTSSPDSKPCIKPLSTSRRSSEVTDSHSFQPPLAPSALNMPTSPSELRAGKRVRKLKKRKALKKALGLEQPESTDTEMDEEASRPRFLRPRRRPSGGSQVSTSSLPTEDKDGDVKALRTTVKAENVNHKDMVELPQAATTHFMVTLDSEESMEVTCQQPHMDAPLLLQPPAPDSSSLACNEVSSTSDMDLCKSSESDLPFATTQPKNSSDASSDHGEDDMPTDGAFEGHQEAVNAMHIHKGLLYTCSGDRTVKAFDLVSHKCVGVFEGHSSKVSCLSVSAAPGLHHRLYSGSSDQTIRCYSLKTRELEQQFCLSDRVLCLHSRWRTLYAGLGNGTVVTFNLKSNKQMDVFECHAPRAVSCLASSQEGARRILLVGSFDNTISVRDAKNGLLLRTLEGHTKTVLCMKVVNDLVFSGSSDQCVHAHNIHSHEQLQVYGGHKDMVMCMSVHKNMIYTGCYDGSIQAVKLNLMQNYRCWWHGCSLVFGLTEHLQQHLIKDHTGAKLQTIKCRWKNCEEFFCSRNSSKQGMQVHMQKHAEEETEVEP